MHVLCVCVCVSRATLVHSFSGSVSSAIIACVSDARVSNTRAIGSLHTASPPYVLYAYHIHSVIQSNRSLCAQYCRQLDVLIWTNCVFSWFWAALQSPGSLNTKNAHNQRTQHTFLWIESCLIFVLVVRRRRQFRKAGSHLIEWNWMECNYRARAETRYIFHLIIRSKINNHSMERWRIKLVSNFPSRFIHTHNNRNV